MFKLTDQLSQEDLTHQLCVVNDTDPPDFIFMLLFQCRRMIQEHGISWAELGTTELKLKVLLNASQIKHLVKELMAILAKNQKRPLNFMDAQRLWIILGELENHNADWGQLPISHDGLLTIIELAEDGYTHLVQTA